MLKNHKLSTLNIDRNLTINTYLTLTLNIIKCYVDNSLSYWQKTVFFTYAVTIKFHNKLINFVTEMATILNTNIFYISVNKRWSTA